MPLISSYQIRCQFLVLVQKHTTSNPLTQFALSNLVTHIFTVDMFPYKITHPLQSSVQSLNFQKSSEICCFPAFISLFSPADIQSPHAPFLETCPHSTHALPRSRRPAAFRGHGQAMSVCMKCRPCGQRRSR